MASGANSHAQRRTNSQAVVSFATEARAAGREAEARGLPYPFKLRLTKNVKRMISKLSQRDWVDAGQGFSAKESEVRLEGWSRQRRAIVLRRRLRGAVAFSHDDGSGMAQLSFAEIGEATDLYEYSALVTRSTRRSNPLVSSIAIAAMEKTPSTR